MFRRNESVLYFPWPSSLWGAEFHFSLVAALLSKGAKICVLLALQRVESQIQNNSVQKWIVTVNMGFLSRRLAQMLRSSAVTFMQFEGADWRPCVLTQLNALVAHVALR